jgi:hypothetical protein
MMKRSARFVFFQRLSLAETSDGTLISRSSQVFIDSPNANAVSSLDIHANWVITSCDARSDQPQVALAYCSKPGDPACSHVFIGGAENTIVQMPKSCGLGPYARVAALAPHANQSILYAHGDHQQRKRADEPVYELHFDYSTSL